MLTSSGLYYTLEIISRFTYHFTFIHLHIIFTIADSYRFNLDTDSGYNHLYNIYFSYISGERLANETFEGMADFKIQGIQF